MNTFPDKMLAVLDEAYANPEGLRLNFKDLGTLQAFRMKLYRRRMADRRQAAETYNQQPVVGVSPYDDLAFFQIRLGQGRHQLWIKRTSTTLELEDKDGEPIEVVR